LFRSVFGLLSRLNHRKSLTENTNKQTEKLPDLPPTVRLSIIVFSTTDGFNLRSPVQDAG
jgi:hypothetical protein